MDELKIVITGCVGSGKSTAIQSISDTDIIATDVDASDEIKEDKDTTTVALDYGELKTDDGQLIKIYGTPGQDRFSFMWEILAEGALGIAVLVNHQRPDPVGDLDMYLANFRKAIEDSTVVVGITHLDDEDMDGMDRYYDYMAARGLDYPIFPVDARSRFQVNVMIEAMAAMISLDEEEYV